MTLIETQGTYDDMLIPARAPEIARTNPFRPGVSLTIPAGRSMAIKTSDQLLYPFVSGASDGTELWAGFAAYSFRTDANGLAYMGTVATAAAYRSSPSQLVTIYQCGVFRPNDVTTSATNTKNKLTYTPAGTITTGDINTITYTAPNLQTYSISFTVGATTTATAVANGLRAAWNAHAYLPNIATASGTATFIIEANIAGNDIAGLFAPSVTGVGTLTEVETTAEAGRVFSQIVTARPGSYIEPGGLWHVV